MLKRQFCMLKAQGRLPLDLPLRPMKAWLLAGKRVFLEREAETWKRWRKVSVAELTWDAKRGLELQETETEIVILLSGQRVPVELRIPNVIVDTAPDGDIQLLKEECWKLNFLHLKDETCLATELSELYGHSETSSKETLIEEKRPKTKCPASVAGAADIDNTNEEASVESPNNNVVDVQAEPLALVGVEKEAAGDGKVLSKVVKPKVWLKEGCKDQLTRKFYDMIAELPKSYFESTESLHEMCGRGPEVCSRVPEVCSRGPEVCRRGPEVCRRVPEVRCRGPEVRCRGPEVSSRGPEVRFRGSEVSSRGPEECSRSSQVCSRGPEVCSGVPEVSNAVGEVSSDTKKTEATGALLNTGNGLRKVVQLSTESRPEVCSGVAELCSGPEVCSGGPEVCSGVPGVSSGGPGVCSGVPEVSNAVEEVSSDTKTTEAAEDLLDTGNVLSKVVNPKGWLKDDWEDQLTQDFNYMIAKLPKSYFGSTESLPEVCSRGPEASNTVEEVCSDTKKTEATGNPLKTGNGLSKVVQLSTESRPEVCSSHEVCIRVSEVFNGGPEVYSGVPDVCSGGPEVSRGSPEVFSEVPEAPNAVEEVSSDTKKTAAAENLLDTENVLSKVVNPKGWLKEGWEDQLTRDFNNMIAKLPRSYFGSTESIPEVCSRGPEASNTVEEVCSDTNKNEATGNLLKTGNGLSKVVQLSTESRPEVCSSPEVCIRVPEVFSGRPEASNAVEEVSSDTKTTVAAEDLLDTGNLLSKVVNSKGWLKEGWEDQLTRDFNNMIAKLPRSYFGSTESLPEVCSRGPEASNTVEEVCSDTKKTEATGNLLKTGNGLSKVVQLSTESHPEVCSSSEVCIRVPEVFNGGPEVCSGVPDVCSGGPEVCRGSPEVFSEVPEAPNAVEEVSSDTKKTAAAENLLDTENVLSKVVNPKGWLKEDWEDQLTRDFNNMIAKLPKSYFGSTESLPEVCSRGPEASNAVEEVCSDTKKTEATGNLLKTGNGLSKVVQLSTESRPEVCSSPEVCIRVPEVFSGGPEVCSGVPGVSSGGPGVCRGRPEVFSEVPEAPNAVEEVSSDTKTTDAAENLMDTENVLSKVVNPKGWLKEDLEDQLTRDFNNMIAKPPKSYFGSTERLPEVSIGVPEVLNAVEEVCSDTKKTETIGDLLNTGNGLSKVMQLSTESSSEVSSGVTEALNSVAKVSGEIKKRKKNGVLRFFRRVWKFFTCTNSLPKEE
ncbi:uncharacterized protein LOC121561988 [Coregonus clupeaformis]|uniref:uncharacterized protein LOC121561988 n=1 Tax=Coregonus clupeaformis TaxID=59861 RepID=UPI001E1C4C0E|nr:uncharacterized protein LOC121561988 [Coregonus clupeaformis]